MPRRNRWQLSERPAAPEPERRALEVVSDVAHAVARADDPGEAFQFALDRVSPAVGANVAAVFLLEGISELMRVVAAHAWPERWRPWLGEMQVRIGFGPAGEAAAERRLIEVPDVFADPDLEDWQEVAHEIGFRAIVSLPLEAGASVLGAASFYFATPGPRTAAEKALLRAVADLMAVIAERDALRTALRRAEAALEDERPGQAVRFGGTADDRDATAE